MILLNKCGKITVDNNKTNITFPFEIKDDFKSIKISFVSTFGIYIVDKNIASVYF